MGRMSELQLDLLEGKARRDESMEQVSDNSGDFIDLGLSAIKGMLRQYATGEDIRISLQASGIVPHHHNAWGALIRTAIKRGLLFPTERFVNMRDAKSHARMTRVYSLTSERINE